MSDTVATAAVASALTPYCVQNAQGGLTSVAVMAKIADARSDQRRSIAEKAGWTTPLGSENPDRAQAESCLTALTPDA